ncbi:DEAD/DEAH box helicase [Pelagovum pacificum]|uniref:DEAD/DEAH box helicase n=1 Tax=Pelagovum pacificum TaxID=2588711 RepID=A0A5C5GBE8_9RHOB|nr:DEAD/DEAH box helicase [Pelagovum pacificum]QQA42194.1 DEAD/DEAH box helicase [Pelagovum pacificum]TNY31280.1 DEAD/DEAH box helicase [Pelagovum pacificum]
MIQTLSDALAERGYDTLTPVQEAVTDPELASADLLVSAQTGSGKTVGFGLAIGSTLLGEAETLGLAEAPLALIIAPTRELAFQVSRELGWLYAKTGARVATCVGGMDMRDERRALERGAHIVVGTPGRLRDHIQRGSLDMTGLRAVVLDEADEMLDLGFREDLEFMLGEAPEDRRTLMFSATVPPSIATLAKSYQRDAVRVTTLSEKSQHADIAYQAMKVADRDAENAIINVLRFHEAQNAIVFANTRATVNRLTARFANRGFAVVCLSGELSQSERTHALQAMRDGRARVCVATDVAARGIDLPNLELVIHAELPTNAEGLLHRSGRTGRAGRKGISALIVPPKMVKRAERLLKFAKVTAEWTTAPDAADILRRDEERLLSDPSWSDEATEEEAAFAERLLAAQSPTAIAAAYLRLYRTRHSAPEELSDPDVRTPPKERVPFGPSSWFSLSVGREERAEARWLLPLLCRAGRIDKSAIGAIRVQQGETFVEIAEASVERFTAALGDGQLEEGVTARKLDSAPDFARGPQPSDNRPSGPRPRREGKPHDGASDRPQRRDDYKPRKPRPDAPRDEAPAEDTAPRQKKTFKARQDNDDRPRKPRSDTPRDDAPKAEGAARPKRVFGGAPDRDGKPRKPRFDGPRDGAPKGDGTGRPKKSFGGSPDADGKPRKPRHKATGKPGKPAGPNRKPGGKQPPKRRDR